MVDPPEEPHFEWLPPPEVAPAAPEPVRHHPELERPATDSHLTYYAPAGPPDGYSRLALLATAVSPFTCLFGGAMPLFGVAGVVLGVISLVRQKRNPELGGEGNAWLAIVAGLGLLLLWAGLRTDVPVSPPGSDLVGE
jgi:hypothetical protein